MPPRKLHKLLFAPLAIRPNPIELRLINTEVGFPFQLPRDCLRESLHMSLWLLLKAYRKFRSYVKESLLYVR